MNSMSHAKWSDNEIQEGDLGAPVKVFVSPECALLENRLLVSNGTRSPKGDEVRTYESSARLPRGPWRLPTKAESEISFLEYFDKDDAFTVSIVKYSQELFDVLRNKTIHSIRMALTVGEVGILEEAISRGGIDKPRLMSEILSGISVVCKSRDAIYSHGLAICPPNLLTVSIDPRIAKYVGLHVDSWEGGTASDRVHSGNRISINVGPADRYFLFVPYSIANIANLVASEHSFSAYEVTSICRYFMGRFPDIPVLRVCIKPGEAYIAPTENIIHDGCSIDQKVPSRHLVFRGRFKPR
jgi:hypothetical protein